MYFQFYLTKLLTSREEKQNKTIQNITMLKVTQELKDYLNIDNEQRNGIIIDSFVNSILKCGTKADADLLLEQYIMNPFDFDHAYLLKLFRKFGDLSYAQKIFNTVIIDNKLIKDAPPETLEILGHLKYEPVKNILSDYGFGEIEADYYLQRSSILGLLHFDCKEFEQKIKEGIFTCYGKNLFPEFLPAMVCKLPDQNAYLEKLFEVGDEYASTDCNAGIILGFSLCPDEGRKYFNRALFNPNWEIFSGSTGTICFAYEGLKNLNMSIADLYPKIQSLTENVPLEYHLRVLFSLFEQRIRDYDDERIDRFSTLYTTFYGGSNSKEFPKLNDLAERIGKEEEATTFEKIFEFKMTEERIIKNYCS